MSDDLCSICHETLDSAHTEVLKPCNHTFHSSCIIKALRRSGRCPNCRDPGENGPRDDDEHVSDHEDLYEGDNEGFDEMGNMMGGDDGYNTIDFPEPMRELEESTAFMYVRRSVLEELKVALRSRRQMTDDTWTELFCKLVSWSPPNETIVEPSTWQPGWYEITHDRTGVSDDMELAVHPKDFLYKGQIVRVCEIVQRDDLQRIRGRLEGPSGWISLVHLQDGYHWVKPAEDLCVHVNSIPVCEKLIPLQMLQVAALFDIRSDSHLRPRWRQRLREQLGRAGAEDSDVRRVGFVRLGDMLVQAELRAEVMRKQYESVPDNIMVGELEAGLIGEDGRWRTDCYCGARSIEPLKSNLTGRNKECSKVLKAEVIAFFQELRHSHYGALRCLRGDTKPEPTIRLMGDAGFEDLYNKLADSDQWDPIGEVELLIRTEEELGLSGSARSRTERMKAAKAKALKAQHPACIGDPDWNLRPRHCAELAVRAEQRLNAFVRERLSTERARELLVAYCPDGPTHAPIPKATKTKAKSKAKAKAKKKLNVGAKAAPRTKPATKARSKPLAMKRTMASQHPSMKRRR